MPSLIFFNAVVANSPQQNAGVFFGETNINGWDANQKYNAGQAGTFGLFVVNGNLNYMFDGFELVDGAINDPDLKNSLSGQA